MITVCHRTNAANDWLIMQSSGRKWKSGLALVATLKVMKSRYALNSELKVLVTRCLPGMGNGGCNLEWIRQLFEKNKQNATCDMM
jgi:hypothetical protein